MKVIMSPLLNKAQNYNNSHPFHNKTFYNMIHQVILDFILLIIIHISVLIHSPFIFVSLFLYFFTLNFNISFVMLFHYLIIFLFTEFFFKL